MQFVGIETPSLAPTATPKHPQYKLQSLLFSCILQLITRLQQSHIWLKLPALNAYTSSYSIIYQF